MRLLAYAAAALSIMVAGAAAEPVDERKQLMRERGGLMRILAPIAQGQQPFDAATVLDALEKLDENARKGTDIEALWPAGSDTGDTKSSPRIWQDRDGYQAASDKYAADTAAAVAANPQDLDAYRAVFGPVAANCGSCHEGYRL